MTDRFTIIWSHSAVEVQLAGYVLFAMESGYPVAHINSAMQTIDRILSGNPQEQGESRSGFERVLIVPPLAVVFEVYEEDNIVYISKVGFSAH
jgi:hypothetical protein